MTKPKVKVEDPRVAAVLRNLAILGEIPEAELRDFLGERTKIADWDRRITEGYHQLATLRIQAEDVMRELRATQEELYDVRDALAVTRQQLEAPRRQGLQRLNPFWKPNALLAPPSDRSLALPTAEYEPPSIEEQQRQSIRSVRVRSEAGIMVGEAGGEDRRDSAITRQMAARGGV